MLRLEVAVGGSYARLTSEAYEPPNGETSGGIRGKVRGFTRASRKRLLDLLNSIDRSEVSTGVFVSLTYPSCWPDDCTAWKRALDVFLKRLLRKWPEAAAIWRMEFQQRGAPHFHLLIFGVRRIPKTWLSRSWYEVVDSGDPRHLAAGTRVRRVRSWRGVVGYVSKRIGQEQTIDRETGRLWGVAGRKNLPVQLISIPLASRCFYRLRRVFRGWLERVVGRRLRWTRQPGVGMTAYLDYGTVVRLMAWSLE